MLSGLSPAHGTTSSCPLQALRLPQQVPSTHPAARPTRTAAFLGDGLESVESLSAGWRGSRETDRLGGVSGVGGGLVALPWRRRLSQDGALLGRLTRIAVETVLALYAARAEEGGPGAKSG